MVVGNKIKGRTKLYTALEGFLIEALTFSFNFSRQSAREGWVLHLMFVNNFGIVF